MDTNEEERLEQENARLRAALMTISNMAPQDQPSFGYPFSSICQFHIAFAIWSVAQIARSALARPQERT